ncbi:acyl-CoA thioesterase [Sungkyunkwania multivorans]|uniref:Acyl-CoA thioesterase n=1 Tax=Sungkyunkwania multivorans TaxID=1173618 RepID=A0ABW3D0P8_9FLAO
MYSKEFDIRWNDLDANRHLANSSYIAFMAHTRMAFLGEHGFGHRQMQHYNIGPVIFYEHVYYFREVFAGHPIKVTLELGGMSEDGMFYEFIHNFYDYKGRNMCRGEMMGGWLDLGQRKLIGLPDELRKVVDQLEHSANFRLLTREDTRKYAKKPVDLKF